MYAPLPDFFPENPRSASSGSRTIELTLSYFSSPDIRTPAHGIFQCPHLVLLFFLYIGVLVKYIVLRVVFAVWASSCDSLLISILYPVSLAARRAFCPFFQNGQDS